jgi:hypothetical protein
MLGAMRILCAWCPPVADPQENDSHGICEDHADQLMLEHVQRQFDKVPSYVDREAFEEYIAKKRRN